MTEQTKWKLIAKKLPPVGKEVLLLRIAPSGFKYTLIGRLRKGRLEFDIADGMQYQKDKMPVTFLTAWCQIPKFDALDQLIDYLNEQHDQQI